MGRDADYRYTRKRLREGASLETICAELHGAYTPKTLMNGLNFMRERNREATRKRRDRLGMRKRAIPGVESIAAPPEVLAALDERMSRAPRDLTAALMGDPLPGYSALDQ
jgi:hypothetical protein